MVTRQILIANNKTQRRYTIDSSATTLGELKAQMRAQGIDFTGMTFTEGISKTQLISDDSLLPTNVMYKGAPTNNLVMLLTNTKKQIASGAMSRKEMYAVVKELGLQDEIKNTFGKNFTMVSNDALAQFIADNTTPQAEENTVEKSEETRYTVKDAPHKATVEWFYDGIKRMVSDNLLFTNDIVVISALTTELASRMKESEQEITDSDIQDMMDGIGA